ncbi:MAG: VTT domain-containing protein [Sphingomonadales bacterium]|nr:VTT domain-containing protein [Sphingomonadales bacterium]MBD3772156.1 VTT domain-containing protein [Paracoccaceae bacterium]
MRLDHFIARYGLFAVGVGAAIEGETVVATGGLFAHHGVLPFWGVVLAAAIGSSLLDQALFLAGRSARDSAFIARIRARKAFARALDAVERHPTGFIFAFRFLWGLRTVSPVAIGTAGVEWRRFAALNVVAALIWAAAVASFGYVFGTGLAAIGAKPRSLEHFILAIAALGLLLAGAGWLIRRRWTARDMGDERGS